jgi:tetratricopeptide (TPR) repeat protein
MNDQTRRAMVFYHQSRFAQAAKEFRAALAVDQHAAYPAAMLAICLAKQGHYQEATAQAQSAVGQHPESSVTHFALSVVMRLRNRYDEALAAINEAIRLEANEPSYHRAAALVNLLLFRHEAALTSATRAFELDPQAIESANLKAMILLNSNRVADAKEWMQSALSTSPNNAMVHANVGWALAQGGSPNEALEYFREAMRLDPTLEWAREGTLFTLKTQYLPYRLGYALNSVFWKMPRGVWMLLLAVIAFSFWMIHRWRSSSPELSNLLLPVMIGFLSLPVALWAAGPLFNLLVLLFNKQGRNLQTRDHFLASIFVGILFIAAIAFVAVGWSLDAIWAWWAALTCGLAMPAVAVIYRCERGRPRNAMAVITLLLVAFGTALTVLSASEDVNVGMPHRVSSLEKFLNAGFFVAVLASLFAPFSLTIQRITE